MRTAEQFRCLVLAAQLEINRILGQQLRRIGLTPPQAKALRVLSDYQPLTLSGLGERLLCETGTNPSRPVERLGRMGLVNRRQSSRDQREVQLTMAGEGEGRERLLPDIEEAPYGQLDVLTADRGIDPALALLTWLVGQSPIGHAVRLRECLSRHAAGSRGGDKPDGRGVDDSHSASGRKRPYL